MNQETRTIQSSESDETKGYFDIADNNERIYSFDQRIALKLIFENEETFILAQEVPYNISQIMNKRYLIENQPIIGSGSFGTVFICWHLISKYFCAVKVHQRCQAEEILQQVNEYKIQSLLNEKFPNSSLFLCDRVYVIQESINYFTTYAGMEIAFTTLYEYIAIVDIQYDEFLCIYHSILQQILEMHSLRIAHRDIKLSNIMYTHQKGWLISDFGCAQFYENQKGKYLIQGTRQYLPPTLRNLLKNNFQQIEWEQNLFDNDIYSFLLSMLQIYKKGSSILQLQQMLDNDCLLQQLPLEFKIHGKSYNYIKLNILLGLNKVPLQKQFEQEKTKQVSLIFEAKLQSSDYIIELIIKKLKLFNFSVADIWHSYRLSPKDEPNYELKSSMQGNQEVNQILQQYHDLIQNDFIQVEDKSLLEINSNTKKWQYNLIQIYYLRLGNVQKQYNVCLEMQKYVEEFQVNNKLQEIECLIELDQLETAHQILEELTNQQYLLDDIQYVRLEIYRIYLEKSWLESAVEISKYYFKVQMLFQQSVLITRINNHFTWILFQFNYTYDDFKIDVSLPESLEFYFRKSLIYFGITDPKDIIKQLEQRGADKYGIRQILLILLQTICYTIQIQDNTQVDELFEQAIQYYEQNNLFKDWEIYYHYSIYCQKKLQYQKSLSLILKAMQLVDKSNNIEVLQTLFQQMYCEIKLDQCQEYQNTLKKILMIIKQVQSSQCRFLLIKRVQRLLYLIFIKQQYSNQIFIIMQQYLQSETNTEILSFLYKLEWETILTYRHPLSLINFFNNKMINIFLYSNTNDIDMLKCQQNIAFVSRQSVNFDQNIENKKIAVNSSSKFIQNMIIFEDIFNFNQTETLDIETEISRYAQINKQFKQQQNLKQALNMISEYTFNNYKQFV